MTKLTWKFIPEPTAAQIAAAKSNEGAANNSGAAQGTIKNNGSTSLNQGGALGPIVSGTPQIKNHTATLYKGILWVFGGYDGKKNHSSLRIFDTVQNVWIKPKKTHGNPPMGRNGHTATLVGKFARFEIARGKKVFKLFI